MQTSKWNLATTWVLTLSIAAFLIPVAWIEYRVLQYTHGTIAYPVDDTFIHLAIAKNLAFHQVWGISGHEFASAASSLLYPLLLSLQVELFGPHIIIPLLVNLAAGIILLIVVEKWLRSQEINGIARLGILLVFIFFTPLPVLAISGMEHVVQILFSFLFITRFSAELDKGIRSGKTDWEFPWPVYVLGALVTATRYEGLVLVFICCGMLLLKKRFFLSFQLALLSSLPVLLFGIYSLYQGNYFVPNSVLLKSGAPQLTALGLEHFFKTDLFSKLFFSIVGYNTVATQRLLILLPVCILLFYQPIRQNARYLYLLVILSIMVFVHLSVTGYAHFPRYEAYLIGCSTVIIGALMVRYRRQVFTGKPLLTRWITVLLAVFLFFPVILRSTTAFGEIRQACVNIYEQQYQMGQFLHQYYYNDRAAIGDIGAVSYFTEGRNLDMVGLGNIDVARSRRKYYNSPGFMDWLTKRDSVKIAIVYDYFNDPGLLGRWKKIANWQIPNNVACGDDNVSFYAVSGNAGPELKKNLQDFQRSLPSDVVVKYY